MIAYRATASDPNKWRAYEVIDKTLCTPYDGPHGLPLLIVGETDLQIVVNVGGVVGGRGRGAVAAAAARAAQPLEDGPQRGLQRVARGRRLQRRGARPARRARHHGLERAPPQSLEHDSIILIATRRPAPLHLKLLTY